MRDAGNEACFIPVQTETKPPRRGYRGVQGQIAPRGDPSSNVKPLLKSARHRRAPAHNGSHLYITWLLSGLGLEDGNGLGLDVGHVREGLLQVQRVALVDDLVLFVVWVGVGQHPCQLALAGEWKGPRGRGRGGRGGRAKRSGVRHEEIPVITESSSVSWHIAH